MYWYSPPPPEQEVRQPYTDAISQESLISLLERLGQIAPDLVLDRLPLVESESKRNHLLRAGFESALAGQLDAAARYLPAVLDRPWLGEVNLHGACALARSIDRLDPVMAEKLVLAVTLHNPGLALREWPDYLDLSFGRRVFHRVVLAAPDEAMSIASGSTKTALRFLDVLRGDDLAEIRLLADMAVDPNDLPRRQRAAVLHRRIASGEMSRASAMALAGNQTRYFSALAAIRTQKASGDTAAIDRRLEIEALLLNQAFQQVPGALAGDLAAFSARDLYLLLTYGRAEATDAVFTGIWDKYLAPKLRPHGAALLAMLDQTGNLRLRDFVAQALSAERFDALVEIAGPEIASRMVRGIDQTDDPLREAVRVAEVIGATRNRALLQEIAGLVRAEYTRSVESGNRQGQTIYGLLAAGLRRGSEDAGLAAAAERYMDAEGAATSFEIDPLFGEKNICVERYFFYDDEDGVASFESFRHSYEHDTAWTLEEHGGWLHAVGKGENGRRIEIFSNIPVNVKLPANRALEGARVQRQAAIEQELERRQLVPSVYVHRGHAFWVEYTMTYLTNSAKLVVLGSCGGATEVHAVLARSHAAHVIATRGVGTQDVNDPILKGLNDRLLDGGAVLDWRAFWESQRQHFHGSALFNAYIFPDRDAGSAFLRAYYRLMEE